MSARLTRRMVMMIMVSSLTLSLTACDSSKTTVIEQAPQVTAANELAAMTRLQAIGRAEMAYQVESGGQYATLLCGKAGPGGHVELSNAGHCPPIVLSGDTAVALPPTSVPVGLFANAPFPTTRLTLGVGDSLLLYTDGVTELLDATGCEFGRERLVASASRGTRASVGDVVATCVAELERFRGDNQRRDDLTLFMLRRRA